MARFLAEAVTLLLRKPHEMWDLQQDILSAASNEPNEQFQESDASLLPVTALRQAIRVAGSSKIPQASILAICRYVKGKVPHLPELSSSAECLAEWSTCVRGTSACWTLDR